MRTKFVKTSNVLKFEEAMIGLDRRGASEACLVVVDGEPGLGKTTSLCKVAVQNQAVYLRAKKKWRPTWFLNDLLGEMRQQAPHAFEKKFQLALTTMIQRQSAAMNASRTFSLIIDEADHISSNADIMETVRDLSDMTEIPIILVGMGKIGTHLLRFPQIASRVSKRVHFHPATIKDTRLFFDEICEVPVADDLVAFTRSAARGMNREIKEAMANVERFGKRNPASDGGLTMQDMAGVLLMHDRETGQEIKVPNALQTMAAE